MSNAFSNVLEKLVRNVPSVVFPEKRFARALIQVCALIDMAIEGDAEQEKSEVYSTRVNEISSILFEHKTVKETFSPSGAHNEYLKCISSIKSAFGMSDQDYRIECDRIIAEIADNVKDSAWRADLIKVSERVAGESKSSGGDLSAILSKISKSLS